MEVGSKVRVSSHHWLRANAAGVVLEINGDRGDNAFLVKFDQSIVGRGIDGDKLWLSKSQLVAEPNGRKESTR